MSHQKGNISLCIRDGTCFSLNHSLRPYEQKEEQKIPSKAVFPLVFLYLSPKPTSVFNPLPEDEQFGNFL